jgi:peptide deformylase
MALLHILEYPDPRLRLTATAVERVDAAVRRLIDDLFETMYDAPGYGLAANQVDIPKRLIVLDISERRQSPVCLVNPVITRQSGSAMMDEGCLSVPGVFECVERAARIQVSALDRDGKTIDLEADGLLATCIQHEVDHLDGKLFIDRIAGPRRRQIDRKFAGQLAPSM